MEVLVKLQVLFALWVLLTLSPLPGMRSTELSPSSPQPWPQCRYHHLWEVSTATRVPPKYVFPHPHARLGAQRGQKTPLACSHLSPQNLVPCSVQGWCSLKERDSQSEGWGQERSKKGEEGKRERKPPATPVQDLMSSALSHQNFPLRFLGLPDLRSSGSFTREPYSSCSPLYSQPLPRAWHIVGPTIYWLNLLILDSEELGC